MAEDEAIFDLSLKKKKKKKKTPFDMESGVSGETQEATEAPAAPETSEIQDAPAPEKSEEISLDDDFSNLTKKKKKKKKVYDLDELGDSLPKTETPKDETPEETPSGDVVGEDLDFSLPSKKKKKKKAKFNLDDVEDMADEADGMDDNMTAGGDSWSNTDRDYTYDELLNRVFDIMREKNPDMVAGEKKRFVMKPPQVMRVGTKKSSFSNFADICKLLHRQPKHLLAFLLAELGTSGSVDGNNQLIIKGRFQQKQIESVLRRYIKEYVTCHTCRSPDTILQKDTRLFFLQCETCGSRCSVASIKSGFQAVTGKRAAIRAKTT